MLKTFQGQHALAWQPSTNTILEVNHALKPDGTAQSPLKYPKSVKYQWDMDDRDQAASFWAYNGGRGDLQLAPVFIPNSDATVDFFSGETWNYNLITNNCKDFVIQGFELGGANLTRSGPYPSNWTNSDFTGHWNSTMAAPSFTPR